MNRLYKSLVQIAAPASSENLKKNVVKRHTECEYMWIHNELFEIRQYKNKTMKEKKGMATTSGAGATLFFSLLLSYIYSLYFYPRSLAFSFAGDHHQHHHVILRLFAILLFPLCLSILTNVAREIIYTALKDMKRTNSFSQLMFPFDMTSPVVINKRTYNIRAVKFSMKRRLIIEVWVEIYSQPRSSITNPFEIWPIEFSKFDEKGTGNEHWLPHLCFCFLEITLSLKNTVKGPRLSIKIVTKTKLRKVSFFRIKQDFVERRLCYSYYYVFERVKRHLMNLINAALIQTKQISNIWHKLKKPSKTEFCVSFRFVSFLSLAIKTCIQTTKGAK